MLNLAQLEPLPAQLHLEVDATAKLELAVGVPAHAVASAVRDPWRSSLSEKVCNEALGVSSGRFRYPRATCAPPTKLAPYKNRLHVPVRLMASICTLLFGKGSD